MSPRIALLGRPGPFQRRRRPEFDRIREDRPVADLLLPAKIGLRASHRLCQRRRLQGKRSLAGAVFMATIVAYRLDEAHIERWHGNLLSLYPIRQTRTKSP